MEFADQVRSGGVNGLQRTAAAITWGYPDALMTKRPPRTRAENLQSQGLGRRTPGLRIPPRASAGQTAMLPEGSPSPQQPKGQCLETSLSAWAASGCPAMPLEPWPCGVWAGKGAALEEGGAESGKGRPLTPGSSGHLSLPTPVHRLLVCSTCAPAASHCFGTGNPPKISGAQGSSTNCDPRGQTPAHKKTCRIAHCLWTETWGICRAVTLRAAGQAAQGGQLPRRWLCICGIGSGSESGWQCSRS